MSKSTFMRPPKLKYKIENVNQFTSMEKTVNVSKSAFMRPQKSKMRPYPPKRRDQICKKKEPLQPT